MLLPLYWSTLSCCCVLLALLSSIPSRRQKSRPRQKSRLLKPPEKRKFVGEFMQSLNKCNEFQRELLLIINATYETNRILFSAFQNDDWLKSYEFSKSNPNFPHRRLKEDQVDPIHKSQYRKIALAMIQRPYWSQLEWKSLSSCLRMVKNWVVEGRPAWTWVWAQTFHDHSYCCGRPIVVLRHQVERRVNTYCFMWFASRNFVCRWRYVHLGGTGPVAGWTRRVTHDKIYGVLEQNGLLQK